MRCIHWSTCLTALYLCSLLGCSVLASDRWQGRTYPAVEVSAAREASVFFLTNTGGDGGAFGRGDIHGSLTSVDFANLQVGYACGAGGGVYKTEDGGLTWNRLKPNGNWQRIQATTPEDVWLLEGVHPGGQGNVWLWHSTDGGKRWNEVKELHGKLAAYGGKTWNAINFQGLFYGVYDMAIPADVTTAHGFVAYVLGHREGVKITHLVCSDDGGRRWREVPLPAAARTQLLSGRVFFSTSRDGWVAGKSGRCFVTRDGGQTWKDCSLPTDQAVVTLWFDQLGRGFAAVDNTDWQRLRQTVYMTADYGAHWDSVLGGYKQILSFCALGPDHLWGVGYEPGLVSQDIVAILEPDWWKP